VCEISKIPYFLDNRLAGGGEVVSLMRQKPFISRKIPGNHFFYRLSQILGHIAALKIRPIRKGNDHIGDGIRDLRACSTVAQLTTAPLALNCLYVIKIYDGTGYVFLEMNEGSVGLLYKGCRFNYVLVLAEGKLKSPLSVRLYAHEPREQSNEFSRYVVYASSIETHRYIPVFLNIINNRRFPLCLVRVFARISSLSRQIFMQLLTFLK
jgi:hypothetical protein